MSFSLHLGYLLIASYYLLYQKKQSYHMAINYINISKRTVEGFDKFNHLPVPLPEGFVVVYHEEPVLVKQKDALKITLGEEYSLKAPEVDESWGMSVTQSMLDQMIPLVQAFYEYTYLPLKESELLYSEAQQFRTLFDTMPASMYIKDTESRFIRVNSRWKAHVGVDPYFDITGKTDFDVFDFEHAQNAFDDEQEIIKNGNPKEAYEERELLPDGSELWALSTKIPIKDINGHVTGISGVSYDITLLKKSEKEVKNTNEQLMKVNEELRRSLEKDNNV